MEGKIHTFAVGEGPCHIHSAIMHQVFFASFSLSQVVFFSHPVPHCLNSECICVLMGVMVWKGGVSFLGGVTIFRQLK